MLDFGIDNAWKRGRRVYAGVGVSMAEGEGEERAEDRAIGERCPCEGPSVVSAVLSG